MLATVKWFLIWLGTQQAERISWAFSEIVTHGHNEYVAGINDYSENMLEHVSQMCTSVASRLCGYPRGGALCDNMPSELASFRTQVNHPISAFHHIQVMFDNDDGVTVPSQA